jgi:hypothetical protein
MIDVYIRLEPRDETYVAICVVKSPDYSADLSRLFCKVPKEDRQWVQKTLPYYYRVKNAIRFKDGVVEIGDAICAFEKCRGERYI